MKTRENNTQLSITTTTEIIQLLFLLNYRNLNTLKYKERGICYGYAYSNVYAFLDKNYQLIARRSHTLQTIHCYANNLIAEQMATIVPTLINTEQQKNKLHFLLETLDSSALREYHQPLRAILDTTKEKTIHYATMLSIDNETAYHHISAFLDTLSGTMINTLTQSSSATTQNARDLFSLFQPSSWSQLNRHLYTAETIAGIFNQATLAQTLRELSAALLANTDLTEPIAFVMSGRYVSIDNKHVEGHSLLVSIDPSKKTWHFLDSASYNVLTYDAEETDSLAEEIIKEFCENKMIPNKETTHRDFFIHTLTATPNELPLIDASIRAFKRSATWNEHSLTLMLQQELSHLTTNMIINCLCEGSAKEITSFFSDPALKIIATNILINKKPIMHCLLSARTQDPALPSLVNACLESGIELNRRAPDGSTSLHALIRALRDDTSQAATNPILDTIAILLSQGVDIHHANALNVTPLALATCHRDVIDTTLVSTLLKQGANPNQLWGSGSPEHIITSLLERYTKEDNLNMYSSDDTFKRHREIIAPSILATIDLLIEHGANLTHSMTIYDWRQKKEMTILDHINQLQADAKNNDQSIYNAMTHILKIYQEKTQAVKTIMLS